MLSLLFSAFHPSQVPFVHEFGLAEFPAYFSEAFAHTMSERCFTNAFDEGNDCRIDSLEQGRIKSGDLLDIAN